MSSLYRITTPRNERHGKDIARLDISVGQSYHEGEKMIALAEWTSRHFNECVVNVCDSLQRHNLEFMGIEKGRAYKMALSAGDAWINRNQEALNMLPNLTITRWDDWRQKPEWANAVKEIENLYNTDQEFKSVVDQTAQSFWDKKELKANSVQNDFVRASKKYILEEAVYALISSFDNVADIYPGSYLPVFDYMRDRGLPAPQSMTTVSFKRRKQAQKVA